MSFNLIPFPISVIFIPVLVVAAELVLWKLRKNGKTYRMLSNVAIAVGAFFLVAVIIFLVASGLHPAPSN